ncbi:TIGR01457 family HAD-type hydrolase [Halobacillus amylolyticus]|uniref:TIGR01457 family HAD-type hydrolase n=1 Tax=Halobacillus amylolyticus TaxID=2932259 RepID=A0ABY4HB96_9BACI|nr:TIGR01457 family HAD-type hydrolase [Halobacillus amylolyticus]UOR11821.1 TIGR01457 family HAD-type hydrolase [Halobacillus amylolyticus]
MKQYKAYFIDLDGTMYRGNEPIPGAAEFVEFIRNQSVPFMFLTNNSSSRPEQVAEKLNNMGITARDGLVFTSSLATANYVTSLQEKAKVYVIGEEGLYAALEQEGHEITEQGADYVIIGIDRNISYEKLSMACLNVRNGAKLISTNKDAAIPTDRGMLPGNGALTSVISVSTGIEPTFVGKPEAIAMELALSRVGLEKSEVLMVGDNYETDILAGINAGLDTLMVETGVTSFKDIQHMIKQPTYKVKDLYDWLKQ